MHWTKKAVKTLSLFAVLLLSPCALGDDQPKEQDWNLRPFETQTLVSFGVAPGIMFDPAGGDTTMPMTIRLGQRLRLPNVTPLALEVDLVLPGFNIGATLVYDVIRNEHFRLHLVDFGINWAAEHPLSVGRVPRSFDLTLGAGLEVRLMRDLALTVDWRMFMPNPFTVISHYGDFARPVYAEAAKGGQLWIGAAYLW